MKESTSIANITIVYASVVSLSHIYMLMFFGSDLGNSARRFGIWFKPNLMTPYPLT